MRFLRISFLATTILSAGGSLAQAEVKVVTSIKPIHSLVSAVMEGVGEPSLLVKGAGSPHTYSLKPSQAKQLQEADLVFWMGHDLEAFLENSIESIATNAKSVPLMDSHSLTKLEFREGGAFEDHGDHDQMIPLKQNHPNHHALRASATGVVNLNPSLHAPHHTCLI